VTGYVASRLAHGRAMADGELWRILYPEDVLRDCIELGDLTLCELQIPDPPRLSQELSHSDEVYRSSASFICVSSLGRVCASSSPHPAEQFFCCLRQRLRVALSLLEALATVSVSTLVCLAFHGAAPGPRATVAYRNGDRHDCSASNVRWELISSLPRVRERLPEAHRARAQLSRPEDRHYEVTASRARLPPLATYESIRISLDRRAA
jgi:hypothetical protein